MRRRVWLLPFLIVALVAPVHAFASESLRQTQPNATACDSRPKICELRFDSQGANEAADLDKLVLKLPVDTTITVAPGFPANPTKDQFVFHGWRLPDGSWLTKDSKISKGTITLTAVWEQGTIIFEDENITIVAMDFSTNFIMSLLGIGTSQNTVPGHQFAELVEYGYAKAWLTDTKTQMPITLVEVEPATDFGRSIDGLEGDYHVTYYAGEGDKQVRGGVIARIPSVHDD